jgi:hypothetical protein
MEAPKFDKEGKMLLYYSDNGENFVSQLTRLNMVFIGGNSFLLILEVTSPFFGYFHGMSLLTTVLLNLLGSRMLNHYSTRMVNSMWLMRDGKHVEVEFMNAFFLPQTKKYAIRNFGYYEPSRLFNVNTFSFQQTEKLYINPSRNVYQDENHQEMIRNIV